MTAPLTDAELRELERLVVGLDVRAGNTGVCGPGVFAAAITAAIQKARAGA